MELGRERTLVAMEVGGRPGRVGDQQPSLLEAALDAVLGLLVAPVFIIDRHLRVFSANETGGNLLRDQPEETRAALAQRILGTGAEKATVLALAGGPEHFVISLPLEGASVEAAAAALGVRHQLTRRQTEVLSLVVQGHSNREMADQLGCSLRTVEIHLSAVFRKTGQQSRTKLVMWFYRR